MPRFELPLLLQKVVIFRGREVEIFFMLSIILYSLVINAMKYAVD